MSIACVHVAQVPLDQDLYGQFFGGDSYIVKYTYMQDKKECYIIYFWQARAGERSACTQHEQPARGASVTYCIGVAGSHVESGREGDRRTARKDY